ncbi:inositol monophosphatase family protein [candidate division KSB1 bacterium]
MTDVEKLTKFGLDSVAAAFDLIDQMGERGVDVVEHRAGDYRSWDPDVLRVDKDVEDLFIARLNEASIRARILSEEAGDKPLETGADDDDWVYFISDPFDGSLLYKRQIPAFWYTALAIYDSGGDVITAAVGACASRTVDYCDPTGAYTGHFVGGELKEVKPVKPRDTDELGAAFLETYLMKPHYLYPTVINLRPLLESVKFVVPNGGPCGFCDVATGRTDIYLAHRQPFVDVMSGLPVAEKAGCVITDYAGNSVPFEADIDQRYYIVCSANQGLHDQVLDILARIPEEELYK